MSCGSLDVTLVSASFSPYTSFESEPYDTYAILKCTKEQHCTKNAQDQGRLPVWNETFSFNILDQDMSSELLVQVFNVKSEVDELLGIARIRIFDMVGKEEATLCALVNPAQGEVGKLKVIWKWKPGSQTSLKATSHASDSGPVAYPHVANPRINPSEPFSKLEAVSDALAKLSMEKGSGRYSASYPDNSGNFGKEERGQDGEYYSYPPAASGAHPVAHPPIPETCARGGGYPPPVSDAYPPNKDAYPPHFSGTGTYPPNNQGYPPYSGSAYPPPQFGAYPPESGAYPPPAGAYPPSKESYPPYPGSANPPHPDPYGTPGMPSEGFAYMEKGGGDKEKGSTVKEKGKHGSHTSYGQPPPVGYPPSSGAYPPSESYPPPYPGSANPPHPDPYSTPGMLSEGFAYMEKGGGDKEKGSSGKEKGKHGSHTSYGQPPPVGYPPSSYPPAPAGYLPYGPPPGGYPPAPHGYPPAPHGYPPAPHGYPQGYPPASHGYPPAGYPPQGYPPAHSAPAYPPQGYPASGHGSGGHKPDKHGYAAGSYVGHSSSSSKPSKKHKEPKHSSSNKHKKQKSFKGMKFKKFKMFKF